MVQEEEEEEGEGEVRMDAEVTVFSIKRVNVEKAPVN